MAGILEAMNVRGAKNISDYGRLEIERGRCSATMYFRLERAEDSYDGGTRNPDDATQRAGQYEFRIEYSTSGTTYTPAEMAVMGKINAEILDAGNELTVMMAGERIIWTYGIPEPTAEVANVAGGADDERLA